MTIKCQIYKVIHKEMTIVLLVRNEIASIRTDMLRRREGYEVVMRLLDKNMNNYFLKPAYEM
ncbi:hypothetical protein ETA10_03420 [Bacillus subtilis]|nr:hypothetical protein [Bacillus subtilis]RDB50321.1 hypothetical protein DT062_19460 [Bacillus subtilis subsp. subtilis]QAR95787.1 hypothetical protein EQH88_03830 [Bacillus subtilis]QAS06840.1 hypothetical protein EQI48_03420 [Bacillus subtilis]QAW11291.1 hypothetical protein ETA10_03420 [Bacillus subtilis]